MVTKGNLPYVQTYEDQFDEVYVAYLFGLRCENVILGRTQLVSLSTGWRAFDFLLAPLRLLRLALRIRPTIMLTADQVFSWWTGVLLRLVMRANIILMPVAMPHQLHQDRGATLSGLPYWLERRMISWSFWCAHRVLTARAFGGFTDWLRQEPASRHKLILLSALPDALPSRQFYDNLARIKRKPWRRRPFRLIYVGRLHFEKMVDHLIDMMAKLRVRGYGPQQVQLDIIGDGSAAEQLRHYAERLGVLEMVHFVGIIPNAELPSRLAEADAFVSTLTGTSLREAALCGLPLVAYDRDWVHGFLQHEVTALMVPSGDIEALAVSIIRLMSDVDLRERLAAAAKQLADEYWPPRLPDGWLADLEAGVNGIRAA